MRAGALDRRITIQKYTSVNDPVYGPQPSDWVNVVARVPAQVWDDLPSQSERVKGGQRVAERPARVRMRYMRGLTSDMRIIVHNEEDELFEITGGPAEIGRREWTEFTIRAYSGHGQ
jgi:head-tail adaptor